MTAQTPRTLHLVTNSATSSPTTDVSPSPAPPSSFRHSNKRYSMIVTPTCSSPTPNSQTTAQIKASRRKSSIGYFPPDLTENSRRGSLIRRNSVGALNERTNGRVESWTKPGDRTNMTSLPTSSGREAESTPGTPSRDRPPLTLTEKHADLLRFIAQKESKCLELRSQLTMHEAELASLKRKWQRIVNKGLERGLHSAPLSGNADASSAVFDGIKEGVQEVSRLLVAGFSGSNSQSPHTPPSFPGHPPRPKPLPPSLVRKTHSTKESDSSVSTYATSRSANTTARFSQSSMSSFGEETGCNLGEEEVPASGELKEADHNNSGDDDPNVQVLMVRDTGATPTMSPNPEFHQQKKQKQKRRVTRSPTRTTTNGVEPSTSSNLVGESDGKPWTSNIQSSTTQARRRKSRDVSRLDFQQLDFSSLSPSVLLSPPSMSHSNSTSPGASPRLGGSPTPSCFDANSSTTSINGEAGSKTGSSSGLAPMSSIPGLGSVAAGVNTPAMSSWMDNMGKKLGQLQRSSTFTKSQKRASLLLSDMSNSIVNVLAPPASTSTTAVTSSTANGTGASNSNRMKSRLVIPPASPKNPSSSASLLDDEDENETAKLGSVVLKPVSPPTSLTAPVKKKVEVEGVKVKSNGDSDDDEEWNW